MKYEIITYNTCSNLGYMFLRTKACRLPLGNTSFHGRRMSLADLSDGCHPVRAVASLFLGRKRTLFMLIFYNTQLECYTWWWGRQFLAVVLKREAMDGATSATAHCQWEGPKVPRRFEVWAGQAGPRRCSTSKEASNLSKSERIIICLYFLKSC